MNTRSLILALAGAMALSLCACAPAVEEPTQQPTEPPATVEPSAEPTEAPDDEPSAEPIQPPTEEPSAEPTGEVSAPPIVEPSGSPSPEPADDTVLQPSGVGEGDVDLHFFMDELFPTISEYEFPEMELMSDERLVMEYPGLGSIPVKQRLIYTPMMSGVACEFAFVEVEDEDDADAVNAIFQERIQSQIDGGAWYPAVIEQWENNARIFTGEKYVILAVHEMSEYMVEEDFPLTLGLG